MGKKIYIDKKGFTLIELLAVIIILGILMLIAIPSVTEYIVNSRNNAYITTAKKYITGARNDVNSNKYQMYDPNVTYYIPGNCISLETGGDSPYGKLIESYIAVTYDGTGYDYYWTSKDESGMGIYLTYEMELNKDSIKTNVTNINPDIGIGDRTTIIILDESCDVANAKETVAFDTIDEEGKKEDETDTTPGTNSLITAITSEEIALDNVASTYVTSSTGIDFKLDPSNTNGKGLYIRATTANDQYPIYYYRGNVSNNNLIFAGFCWKIIRTTETGGIKIIYNGSPQDGKCNNTGYDTQVAMTYFNIGSSPTEAGYMFGSRYNYNTYSMGNSVGLVYGNDVTYNNGTYTLIDTYTSENGWSTDKTTIGEKYHYTCFNTGTSCNPVYYIHYSALDNQAKYVVVKDGKKIDDLLSEMTTGSSNTNNSNAKKEVDKWYEANMLKYTTKLEDTIWCNDRSIYAKNGWDKDTPAIKYLYFSPALRVNSGTPILNCPSKNDSFTVGSSGNGKLKYPVGLITIDEAMLAGFGIEDGDCSDNYLCTGTFFWAMSAFAYDYYRGLGFGVPGYYVYNMRYTGGGIRPTVSLKKGTKILSGDGTSDNPYKV